MKFAFIKEDIVVSIVLSTDIDSLLPVPAGYQNIVDLSGFVPEPSVGWVFTNNKFSNPIDEKMSQVPKNKKITRLALLNRFTDMELAMYETALQSSIPLKILDKKLFAATYIDLDRDDTKMGINALGSAGILTSERVNYILNAEPSETELYREIENV